MNLEQSILSRRRGRVEQVGAGWSCATDDLSNGQIAFSVMKVTDTSILAPCWRDLERRADASFFLTWDWIGSWLEESRIAPLVVVGRLRKQVILLGAFRSRTQRRNLLVSARTLLLHHVGERDKDILTIEYNGFLVDRTIGQDALAACISFLFGEGLGDAVDEVYLRGACQQFEQSARALSVRHLVRSRHQSWRVDLKRMRESGCTYLEQLGSGTRYELRRSIRLYQERGQLCGARAIDVSEALGFFDEMKQLHQAYWSSRGRAGSFSYPFFERFHRRLIQVGVPAGTVELYRITVGSQAIGYLYNFVHRGWIFAYQSGFRYEKDRRLKPGLVSNYLCIEQHSKDDDLVYDFLSGDTPHKKVLGLPGPEILDIVLQRPCFSFTVEEFARRFRRGVAQRAPSRLRRFIQLSRQLRHGN